MIRGSKRALEAELEEHTGNNRRVKDILPESAEDILS